MKRKTSRFARLDWMDGLHGLVLAVVSGALDGIVECASNGISAISWHRVGTVAGISAAAYLKIKFFTPAKVITSAQ